MKYSIIIPIYKGQKFIEKIFTMIETMGSQKWKVSLELILVNDYPDEPLVITNTKVKYKVIENKQNIGIHGSRLVGVSEASGEYVIFLDQDDELDDRCLFYLEQEKIKEDVFIYNGIWRDNEQIFSASNPIEKKYCFQEYLIDGYPLVSLGQMAVKRSIIPSIWKENVMKINGWDDHFLWASLMRNNVKVGVIDKILYKHVEDGTNLSFNWQQMAESGKEFKSIFLKCINNNGEQDRFIRLIDKKVMKYEKYASFEQKFSVTSKEKIEDKLLSKNINTVAIYGMGVYAQLLLSVLNQSKIKILYGVDKRNDVKKMGVKIYALDDTLPKADSIIITPISEYQKIKKELEKKVKNIEIISIEELL